MRKPQRPPLPKRTSINLEPYLDKLESLRDRDTGWAAMSASKLAEFLLSLGLDVSEQASVAEILKKLERGQRRVMQI